MASIVVTYNAEKGLKQTLDDFVINHDNSKLFLIVYIGGAAIIAITCGLFYFAVWVLAHFGLEIYKRNILYSGFSLPDIIISLSHCKLDLAFLFVGLCIEVVSHHSLAFAITYPLWYLGGAIRIFKIKGLASLAELMPRAFGTIKAGSCVFHLGNELVLHPHPHLHQKSNFQIRKSDMISLIIIILSIIITFLIPLKMGFTIPEILLNILHLLSP